MWEGYSFIIVNVDEVVAIVHCKITNTKPRVWSKCWYNSKTLQTVLWKVHDKKTRSFNTVVSVNEGKCTCYTACAIQQRFELWI